MSFTRCRNAPVDIAGQIYGVGDDVIDELLKRHAKSCSLRRFNRTVLNCQPRRWFLRFLGGGDSNSSKQLVLKARPKLTCRIGGLLRLIGWAHVPSGFHDRENKRGILYPMTMPQSTTESRRQSSACSVGPAQFASNNVHTVYTPKDLAYKTKGRLDIQPIRRSKAPVAPAPVAPPLSAHCPPNHGVVESSSRSSPFVLASPDSRRRSKECERFGSTAPVKSTCHVA